MPLAIKNLPIWLRLATCATAITAALATGILLHAAGEQRALALEQAHGFAAAMAQTTEYCVTEAMATGDTETMERAIAAIRSNPGIRELHIGRAASVVQQYGPGKDATADAREQQVLRDGKPRHELLHGDGGAAWRAVLPLTADDSERGRSCLACHTGGRGEVLGAVSIAIDLQQVEAATDAFLGRTALASLLFGVPMLLGLCWLIRSAVSRPLRRLTAQLRDIADGDGDLTRRIEVRADDEVGRLGSCFNTFVGKLHDIIGRVRSTAAGLAAAAQQVSATAEEVSTGTHEQAASLQETAASLGQLNVTVQQGASTAQQAAQLALGSRDTAERGGQVVTDAVASMREITGSSQQITSIVDTIDGLAFQTNLLALNAAVEAARAGEQGKGFAVVAGEVRHLAQRSAAAAREIRGLIDDSGKKVEAGAALVGRSGETLQQIVDAAKQVSTLIDGLAGASREQAQGIDLVSKTVTEVDRVVQSNVAQMQQLSATSAALAGHARDLQQLVGRFQLQDAAG